MLMGNLESQKYFLLRQMLATSGSVASQQLAFLQWQILPFYFMTTMSFTLLKSSSPVVEPPKRMPRPPSELLYMLEVPYLVDHNTGQHMGDYKRIISYLFKTYATINV